MRERTFFYVLIIDFAFFCFKLTNRRQLLIFKLMTGFIWGVIIFCLVVFVLFAYAVYRTDVWRVYDAEHGLSEKKKSKNVKV